jgi:NADH:ubiquinone oxidoreductase subunit 4 (subunit M)
VQGAVYQMLNHGVSTGGLFMMVGMLSDRRHTRLIAEFGGLKAVVPRLVAAFLVITLSSIALPFLNGFVGEFLILIGAFRFSPMMTAVAASGVILSAVYMLWMFQRVNYGPVTNEKNRALPDLTPREWALVVPTIAMAVLMGVLPGIFLRPMEPSVNKTIERVTGAPPQRIANSSDVGVASDTSQHSSALAGPSASARLNYRCATARPRRSWSPASPATSEGGHPRSLSLGDFAPRSGRGRC